MAKVIEIVKSYLVANGFDGLVQVDAECGCLCDDLAPCQSDYGQCEPGYRGAHEDGGLLDDWAEDWAMYRTKERALESVEKAKANRKTPNACYPDTVRDNKSAT